jgi:hypothetical protein
MAKYARMMPNILFLCQREDDSHRTHQRCDLMHKESKQQLLPRVKLAAQVLLLRCPSHERLRGLQKTQEYEFAKLATWNLRIGCRWNSLSSMAFDDLQFVIVGNSMWESSRRPSRVEFGYFQLATAEKLDLNSGCESSPASRADVAELHHGLPVALTAT